MVDCSATEKWGSIIDVLSEKDEEGGYISGGWKSEGERLSCGYSSFRGKRATMKDLFDMKTSKIARHQSPCLVFLMVNLYVANVGDSCTTISKAGKGIRY